MSAIVCGKRSFFEDLPTTPPVSKRIRCSSSSPVRFSPPRSFSASPSQSQSPASQASVLDHLRAIFPDMDKQVRPSFFFLLFLSLQEILCIDYLFLGYLNFCIILFFFVGFRLVEMIFGHVNFDSFSFMNLIHTSRTAINTIRHMFALCHIGN